MAMNHPNPYADPTVYNPDLKIWRRNPAMIVLLVNSAIVMVGAFGIQMDAVQLGAVLTFVNVLLSVIYNVPLVSAPAATAQVNEALMIPAPNQNSKTVEVKTVEVEEAAN
jgi:hypothetical protein